MSAALVQATGAIALHYHESHDELVVVVEGTGTMRVGSERHPASPGAIFFVPRGTLHAFLPEGAVAAVSVFGPAFDGKDRIFVGENGGRGEASP